MEVPYPFLGTNYRSLLQGSISLEDGTDWLSLNVTTELPILRCVKFQKSAGLLDIAAGAEIIRKVGKNEAELRTRYATMK
jgi:hypothetical protein